MARGLRELENFDLFCDGNVSELDFLGRRNGRSVR